MAPQGTEGLRAPGIAAFFGFALYEAWKYLVLFSGTSAVHRVSYLVSLGTLAMALAALIAIYPTLSRNHQRFRAALTAAATLLALAGALVSSSGAEGAFGWGVASGIASGLGTALIDVLWIERLATFTGRQLLGFALCFIVAETALVLGLRALPLSVVAWTAVAMPLGSCALLWPWPPAQCRWEGPLRPIPPYIAGWCVFGLSVGLLCALSRIMEDQSVANSPWILAITLTALALLAYLSRSEIRQTVTQHDGRGAALLLLFPALVLALVAAPAIIPTLPALQDVRVTVSFALWELFLIYLSFAVAQRFSLSVVRLYLLLNVGRSVGVLLGALAAYLIALSPVTAASGTEHVVMMVVVLACQIMLVMSFMLARRNLEENAGRSAPPLPLEHASTLIAKRYMLTRREEEVLGLLAKGRTATRIAEELCISLSTVTTHMNHIYQKCDVHSKQQLLDLCEGALADQ